jgi:hypothetical protein
MAGYFQRATVPAQRNGSVTELSLRGDLTGRDVERMS